MKVMFIGDTHGNTANLVGIINSAIKMKVELLIQVGDFGYWEHDESGVRFLDAVDRALDRAKINLWWIDGNHENHTMLHERHRDDPWVRSRIRWLPRGHRFTLNGVSFVCLGGAGSIDADYRDHGTEWWPGEAITPANARRVTDRGYADVMLTHEAPDLVPVLKDKGLDLTVSAVTRSRCDESRQRLTATVKRVRPKLVIHGHWHHEHFSHTGWRTEDGWEELNVVGLSRDNGPGRQWIVVDISPGVMRITQTLRGLPGTHKNLLVAP